MEPAEQPRRRRSQPLLQAGFCTLPALLIATYWSQPDWLAAATLVPPGLWLVTGGLATVLILRRASRRCLLTTAILWFGFAGLFVEEIPSSLRSALPDDATETADSPTRLRVVTLNCAGSSAAATELDELEADVVLLQEVPGPEALQRLAGSDRSLISSQDLAIIAPGKLRAIKSDPSQPFLAVEWICPGLAPVTIVCLRLTPPVSRLDFWTHGSLKMDGPDSLRRSPERWMAPFFRSHNWAATTTERPTRHPARKPCRSAYAACSTTPVPGSPSDQTPNQRVVYK